MSPLQILTIPSASLGVIRNLACKEDVCQRERERESSETKA